MFFHFKNGKLISWNGKYVSNIKAQTAALTPENALTSALQSINAKKYMWESAVEENELKAIKNNPNATYYPQPTLTYLTYRQKT